MKGLVYSGLNKVELNEVEKPQLLRADDAIIRVTLTTICGSDLHLIHGHLPSTPGYVVGHEYVGIVEEVGSEVRGFKPGDRVIGPAAPYCGQCDHCRKGFIAHCQRGGVHGSGEVFGNLTGAQSEYIRVPFADVNLVHVPDELTDEQVLFVGDILSTGYFAVEKAEIRAGDSLVIFGAGPVGLCAVQSAKLFGARQVILVDMDPFRLETGLKLGATHIIRADQEDVLKKIGELTGGQGADAAIEAVGLEATLQQAVRCVGIGGRVSIVGIFGQDVQLPLPEIFMKNIKIQMGLADLGHMKQLLRMIQTGQLDLTPLITHRMKLSEIETAYKIFENRSEPVIKIVLQS